MAAALVLFLVVVVFRLLAAKPGSVDAGWIQNFSPMASLALCGAAFLPKRLAWTIPLATLFLSDLCLNAIYGVALLNWAMLPQYFAFGLIGALGWQLRGSTSHVRLFGVCVLSSVIFYVISNTASWLVLPGYTRDPSGWWQALTVGLTGFAPTWHFFRNTLVSDLVFTALFVLCLSFRGSTTVPARQATSA